MQLTKVSPFHADRPALRASIP